MHLEGALKGGYAAEPRRAANARNFLPTRAMLPLTAAGKPILLHSAFFQHASVPFQRNFHPLKPGDATTYYQPLGQRMLWVQRVNGERQRRVGADELLLLLLL